MVDTRAVASSSTAEQLELTPAQWLSWDVNGYVLLKGLLDANEVGAIKEALYRLRSEEDLDALRVYVNHREPYRFHVGNLLEYDPALLAYAVHPTLAAFAEKLVGGMVRVEETEAVINSRDQGDPELPQIRERVKALGFHTGAREGWGTYYEDGHFHCLFVKALAYLSDVGPDDGGTAVIPGSHRLRWPQEDIIAAASSDEEMVHQVVAPAGSVLLFPESLVHSTTAIHSDAERVVFITGYSAALMREWPGNEMRQGFLDSLNVWDCALLAGEGGWRWWAGRGNRGKV